MTAVKKYTGPPVTTPLLPSDYPDPLMFLNDNEPQIAADVVDKVNAGARLTYALFLHPHAQQLWASPLMTPALRDAYLAAAKVWGL